jgi:hypothetical protein
MLQQDVQGSFCVGMQVGASDVVVEKEIRGRGPAANGQISLIFTFREKCIEKCVSPALF